MVEFDHFFTFIDPNFGKACKSIPGFKYSFEKEHKGQGTSATFSFFEQFYLEWIWVSNLKDATSGKINADKRSDWKKSGWSPFGIGLKGILSEFEKKDYWLYSPPYSPESKIWVHNKCSENPSLPMIFVQEMKEDEVFSDWWPKKRLSEHSSYTKLMNKSSESTSIELSGPALKELPLRINNFSVKIAEQFSAKVHVSGFDLAGLNLEHLFFH